MSGIALRAYQLQAVDRLRDAMRQHRRVCFQLPTGGGKTIVFGEATITDAQGTTVAVGRATYMILARRA